MNLKNINWKLIVKATILMTIAITIYAYFTNQLSLVNIIVFGFLPFPTIGILLSFSKEKQQIITKGCLYGKTQKMKDDFFESLYKFKDKDLIFLLEQSRDLLEDEFEQFTTWIFDNKYEDDDNESAIYENPINKKDVLQGLKKGQRVIHNFQGKKINAEFIEHRDYGFTAVLKEIATGKEYLAMGNELSLMLDINESASDIISKIPRLKESDFSLDGQLKLLRVCGNSLGLYKSVKWMQDRYQTNQSN